MRVHVCVFVCVRAYACAGSKLRGVSESLTRQDSALSTSSASLLDDDLSEEMEEEIREVYALSDLLSDLLSTLSCKLAYRRLFRGGDG
jgi:hypothetical protein